MLKVHADVSNTGDLKSFAYETSRTRWPKILSQIISEIERNIGSNAQLSKEEKEDGGKIQKKIESLRTSMANNEPLHPLPEIGDPDIPLYNRELATLKDPTWQAAPWLYAECYLYRLIHVEFKSSSSFWQSFDMFATDKWKALVGSEKGAVELVKRFRAMLKAIKEKKEISDEAAERAIFEEMIQISLWGNATDLSLLTSLSVEELQSRQGKAARDKSKANVLVDDTQAVWELLSRYKKKRDPWPIDIVLDSAGFELLADLVLASYLLESGYASSIVLHGKAMPWFVSDVMAGDLTVLVDGFANGSIYTDLDPSDQAELIEAGKYWQGLLKSKRLDFETHWFWTSANPYGRMAAVNNRLYEVLSAGSLVIYKGDLNYRKLTYDGMWPKTTSFQEAIGPFARPQIAKIPGLRTLALRTCKADVAIGLKSGVEETLPDDWTRTGKYALISYNDGTVQPET